jgi:hypothetical protein
MLMLSPDERGNETTLKQALAVFVSGNSWLMEQLRESKTCTCGHCYLCAYRFFEGQAEALRKANEALAEAHELTINLCQIVNKRHQRDWRDWPEWDEIVERVKRFFQSLAPTADLGKANE